MLGNEITPLKQYSRQKYIVYEIISLLSILFQNICHEKGFNVALTIAEKTVKSPYHICLRLHAACIAFVYNSR